MTTAPPPRGHPTPRAHSWHARSVGAGDGGSASVELTILFPVLLLVVTAVLQFGLWFHARSVALAAAQEGVTAARTYTAAPTAGATRARAFIDTHGADTLTNPTITVTTPGPNRVSVQVTGHALSLLPGVAGLAVTQSADGPLERLTRAGDP